MTEDIRTVLVPLSTFQGFHSYSSKLIFNYSEQYECYCYHINDVFFSSNNARSN